MNTVKRKPVGKRKSTTPKALPKKADTAQCVFNGDGLIPVIAQDYESGEVLMLAYMNEEAVTKTFETGYTYYYSLSEKVVSKFGEEDGNVQKVVTAFLDAGKASLLLKVDQKGNADLANNAFSCFETQMKGTYNDMGGVMLGRLQRIIAKNKTNPEEDSYTSFLLTSGVDKIAKKVGEEAVELVIAAKNNDKAEIVDEASDFLYHMMVLLVSKGVKLSEVGAELCKRNR
ncbi:MAG: bifunctional phosphoribosyl-AMP cyclohydrolase/phosphoribosyl-ATP diphosphatase HisIE [Clostridia bacterium]|nr:bifunctional phosphoribosyl-AMP cyclohydrolase/phosphoribosyl-ATP diphosphatase HisIE [Clostridia bacterium]